MFMIKSKAVVTVIGAGHVGFPLACSVAETNKYTVYVYTRNKITSGKINKNIVPISDVGNKIDLEKIHIIGTSDPKVCLPKSNIIIICVPTPIDAQNHPNLTDLVDVIKKISVHLKRNQMVIVESTVSPGTCTKVLLPLLEKSDLKGGKDFIFSYCPERINPGDKKWNINNIPRVVGSLTSEGCNKTALFYRSFIKAKILKMDNIQEAESTKLVENAFRDLNIAFVNELAMMFDKIGIDVTKVIQAASTKPFSFLAHYPSCGVGGNCIGVSPYYLAKSNSGMRSQCRLIKQARKINEYMPMYTVKLVMKAMEVNNINPRSITVGILGLSYKANVHDMRRSPASEIIEILREKNIRIQIYDPYNKDRSTAANIAALCTKCKVLVIAVDHDVFRRKLTGSFLVKHGVRICIDGKNCLDMDDIKKHGIYYKGIGR